VIPVNPYRLNKRLTIQRGLFLCPGDVSTSFENNLLSMNKSKDNVIKYRIPQKRKYEFLEKLFSINISRTTLFPGLEGYAQSLKIYNFFYKKPIEIV
jgi:hypothetical protein